MNFSRMAREVQPSATIKISTKVKVMRAKGINIIGFGMGEPDFPTPDNIKEAGIKAIRDGLTKYTPTSGTPELKEAICEKLKNENGLEYSPNQIMASCGAKQSICNVILALCDKGDEVIIPSPFWVSYSEMVVMAGAKPVLVHATDETAFKISADDLKKAITNNTKLLVLNSPCNPTGCVYTESELRDIVGCAIENGIYIVSDEIYENIIYDGTKTCSPAGFGDEFMQYVITVNGFSKSFAMTGWRLGYAAGREDIIREAIKLQDHFTSGTSSITQAAGIEALKGKQDFIKTMVAEFDKRRQFIFEKLNNMDGISCVMPKGAFYVFPNVSGLLGRKIAGEEVKDSDGLVNVLIDKANIAFVPGKSFGSDNHVRISYATSMENIVEGMKRLETVLAR
ncbi:MAG: pyridoxal phosphate-dependent aminotransferase [Candidatus Anammoxibacter sp.]